jgi:hypothetical protein
VCAAAAVRSGRILNVLAPTMLSVSATTKMLRELTEWWIMSEVRPSSHSGKCRISPTLLSVAAAASALLAVSGNDEKTELT